MDSKLVKNYFMMVIPATGLTSQRSYFVYKVDDSNFKLAETRYDVMNEPPRVVSITANSGGTQELSL